MSIRISMRDEECEVRSAEGRHSAARERELDERRTIDH